MPFLYRARNIRNINRCHNLIKPFSTTTKDPPKIHSTTNGVHDSDETCSSSPGQKSASTSISTIIKNSFARENDVPWTGEEDLKTTVIRMLLDKYPPLRIKRETVKEYVDAHSKRPFATPNYLPPTTVSTEPHKASKILQEKKNKVREAAKGRLVNARDAVIDYALQKKYGGNETDSNNNADKGASVTPKFPSRGQHLALYSVSGWGNLVEQRILESMARGQFSSLPYKGKPLPTDPNESNPCLTRTEFFMNRLIKKQGAAPNWIELQKEIDAELKAFRKRVRDSWERNAKTHGKELGKRDREWEEREKEYFKIALEKLNGRLKSYNIIAPSVTRRPYLKIESEFERVVSGWDEKSE
ncbi:8260_t:CDS:1 [Paraglomus occultum]|uniref:8260_t:CDS:1 n=1 Tax=Paraglomus occultum TaxID=144539 RepID=A0A9N9ATP3_9GLOM|nr:8260_t:CDS:1 [Paraglomus occultum]